MPIDEKERRRPGWVEGEWVTLGDGGRWSFRKPVMRFSARRNESGELEFGGGYLTLGPKFDGLLTRVIESDGGVVQFDNALNLAAYILSFDYDLTDGELAELLPCVPSDEDNAEMWQAIVGVALGQAPKLSSDGSAAP